VVDSATTPSGMTSSMPDGSTAAATTTVTSPDDTITPTVDPRDGSAWTGTTSAQVADSNYGQVDLLSSICGLDIQQELLNDTSLAAIVDLVEQQAAAPDPATLAASGWELLVPQWKRLFVEDGILKKRYPDLTIGGPRVVVVLPRTMQKLFVEACHIESGHQGRDKTAELVQRRVYFPLWRKIVTDVCTNCVLCATYCDSKAPKQGVMQIMEVDSPMDRVAIDLTGPHPTSKRSNRFILTMVDCFSRYLIAVPIRNKYATTVAKAVNRYLFARWGLCRELLTDQGTEFDNKLMKTLCKQYGVRKVRTSGYRPSANGRIERLHRSLNALLAKMVNEHHNDWDEILDAVVAQYNGTVHRSTGFTPNRLMLGRETLTSLDLLVPREKKSDDQRASGDGVARSSADSGRSVRRQEASEAATAAAVKYVDALHQQLSSVYDSARRRSLKAALKRKAVYDNAVRAKCFEVGQLVLLRIEPCKSGLYNKWRLNYEGPFIVKQKLNSVNYIIARLNGSKPRIVHVDRLRHCQKSTPRCPLNPARRRSGGRRASETTATDRADAGDATDFISDPLRRSRRPGRGCQKHPKYRDYV